MGYLNEAEHCHVWEACQGRRSGLRRHYEQCVVCGMITESTGFFRPRLVAIYDRNWKPLWQDNRIA